MENLWRTLPLFFALSTLTSQSQQIALLNAPEPTIGVSSSAAEPGSSAVMPVSTRPYFNEQKGFAAQDWSLLGAAAALRFLDYKSTVKCMSDPSNFQEVELPQALVHNRPALGAFEASTVVANYYAYRMFVTRRHRNMARMGQYVNIGAMAWTVGRNYYELNEFWPRLNDYAQFHGQR